MNKPGKHFLAKKRKCHDNLKKKKHPVKKRYHDKSESIRPVSRREISEEIFEVQLAYKKCKYP